jgi:ribosomal protein S18 acetylase RimI-like enzyme
VAAQGNTDRGEPSPVPAEAKPAPTPVPKPLVVERLTHHDIPEICALYKRIFEPFKTELPPEVLKAWTPTPLEFTSSMEGVTYFAARRDGRLIGAIGCEIVDGACRLIDLGVDTEHRRQGVATALTSAALEWARHNNSLSVWIDALARFEHASALFRHLGFTDAGLLHRHYWNEDIRLFEMLL